ncbi:MAG: transposase [Coriobacteriales bacterium]|nr:transposase [Coriobacteriales bacterium]
MRPKGTTVKAISGHYYVYEQDSVKGEDGKWRTRSGRCVGKIDPERGFVPNSSSVRRQEWRTLEFGQWAVADDLSRETYALIREFLDAEDADRVYVTALCHFVEGLTYTRDVAGLYDMSVLSLRYPGLRLGPDAMSRLYDDLGRRDGPVMEFQRALAERCSGAVAIDGHVVGSGSRLNDLASRGYKFLRLGEPQANLLMALDAKSGRPICSRFYEGRATDRLAVRDLLRQVPFSGVIFLVDRGLDGDENADLLADGGNHYVFPLDAKDRRCVEAVSDLDLPGTFLWQRGGKSTLVQYAEWEIGGRRVVACRDLLEQLETQANYRRHLDRGDGGYTESKLAEQSPYMGVYVLQTSIPEAERDAQAVFSLYKDRWTVETYFDYFKNGQDGHTLCQQDYYRQQGLAFVMLVAGLIECEVREAIARSGLGMSVTDVLMDARAAKADRLGDYWVINNCLRKREQRFSKLGVAMEARPTRAS